MECSFTGYTEDVQRGCGALIVNDEQQVLLVRRSRSARNDHGMWSQPGGAIDNFTSVLQNVRREIREELGVELSIDRFLTTTLHRDVDTQWLAYSYLAKIASGEPSIQEPTKHDDFGWFRTCSLPSETTQVTRDSVEAYQRMEGSQSASALLIFDMDGTLLPETTANLEVARVLGKRRHVERLEQAYLSGSIDSSVYASHVIELYSELTRDDVEEAFTSSPKIAGLSDLLQWAGDNGIATAVVTTGPQFFADKFRDHFGIEHVVGARFPVYSGRIAMEQCTVLNDVDKPIHGQRLCRELGIPTSRCLAVGDSRSDLPLFAQCKKSVALNYSPTLQGMARFYLRTPFAQDLIPALRFMVDEGMV